jgi:hypothetical protein
MRKIISKSGLIKNRELILILICILGIRNVGHTQVILQEKVHANEYIDLEINKYLKVPIAKFDSLVINDLFLPDIHDSSFCQNVSGQVYFAYNINHCVLQNVEQLKGICFDNDFLKDQCDLIYNKLLLFLDLDCNKNYRLVITVRYDSWNYFHDSIFLYEEKVSDSSIEQSYMIVKEGPPLVNVYDPQIYLHIDPSENFMIPENLDECFERLDMFLDYESKQRILECDENDFIYMYNYSFGVFLWEYWGLIVGSELSIYFNNLGIYSSENMTRIIFASYYRYLKGVDIKLDSQLQDLLE